MSTQVLEACSLIGADEGSSAIHSNSEPYIYSARPADMLPNAISSVRSLSEQGDLPLFVWTLGLPQGALVSMLKECSLPSWRTESLMAHEYERIEKMVPQTFNTLRLRLLQYRTRLIDPVHADYLARAVAAACFGNRSLWEDIGLQGDEQLSSLLATFFYPLHQKNKRFKNWKRFVLTELHAVTDHAPTIPEMLLKCVRYPQ